MPVFGIEHRALVTSCMPLGKSFGPAVISCTEVWTEN